jgi:hypothetical protein
MPLKIGTSKKTFGQNVVELKKANESKPEGEKRSMKQILAISYAKKREAEKKRK